MEVKDKPFLDSCQDFALWHFQGPEGWCGEMQRGIGRVNLLGHPRLTAAAMVWKQKLYKLLHLRSGMKVQQVKMKETWVISKPYLGSPWLHLSSWATLTDSET